MTEHIASRLQPPPGTLAPSEAAIIIECPTSFPDVTIDCPNCFLDVTIPIGLAELDSYRCHFCNFDIDLNAALGREPANYGPPCCIHNVNNGEDCTKCAVTLLTKAVRLLLKRHERAAYHEWSAADHKELSELQRGLAALD